MPVSRSATSAARRDALLVAYATADPVRAQPADGLDRAGDRLVDQVDHPVEVEHDQVVRVDEAIGHAGSRGFSSASSSITSAASAGSASAGASASSSGSSVGQVLVVVVGVRPVLVGDLGGQLVSPHRRPGPSSDVDRTSSSSHDRPRRSSSSVVRLVGRSASRRPRRRSLVGVVAIASSDFVGDGLVGLVVRLVVVLVVTLDEHAVELEQPLGRVGLGVLVGVGRAGEPLPGLVAPARRRAARRRTRSAAAPPTARPPRRSARAPAAWLTAASCWPRSARAPAATISSSTRLGRVERVPVRAAEQVDRPFRAAQCPLAVGEHGQVGLPAGHPVVRAQLRDRGRPVPGAVRGQPDRLPHDGDARREPAGGDARAASASSGPRRSAGRPRRGAGRPASATCRDSESSSARTSLSRSLGGDRPRGSPAPGRSPVVAVVRGGLYARLVAPRPVR